MRSRIAHAAVVAAMVGAVFAVQGARSPGPTRQRPVGYTSATPLVPEGTPAACNFYKIDLKTGRGDAGEPRRSAGGLRRRSDLRRGRHALRLPQPSTAGGAGR